MLERLLDRLQKEWGVIRQTPIAFFVAVLAVGTAIFVLMQFVYGSQIDSKDGSIELLKIQVSGYAEMLHQKDETIKLRQEIADSYKELADTLREQNATLLEAYTKRSSVPLVSEPSNR